MAFCLDTFTQAIYFSFLPVTVGLRPLEIQQYPSPIMKTCFEHLRICTVVADRVFLGFADSCKVRMVNLIVSQPARLDRRDEWSHRARQHENNKQGCRDGPKS